MAGSETADTWRESEELKLFGWRFERFAELGFDPETAHVLAADRTVDWHVVDRAVRCGCTLERMLEIVT